MYLLATEQFADLTSRDANRPIARWLKTAAPGRIELFISVISIGVVADSIEDQPSPDRGNWRRLLSEARRQFADHGCIIDVDQAVAEAWAGLRGIRLNYDDGEPVGDDMLLVVATAIARDLTLVTERQAFHDEIADRTTLKIVEP